MKALTVIAPWGWLMFCDSPKRKDIENRNWCCAYRGPLAIHTSKRFDENEYEGAGLLIEDEELGIILPSREQLSLGCVIGTVDVVGCAKGSESPWFCGEWGIVLANPRKFAVPIPARGQLMLWEWEPEQLRGGAQKGLIL